MLNNKYMMINCLFAEQNRTHSLWVVLWPEIVVEGGSSGMTQLFATMLYVDISGRQWKVFRIR